MQKKSFFLLFTWLHCFAFCPSKEKSHLSVFTVL